ncbi:hypothetical protein FWG95_04530 [Candidatus Saccharibacteria bacterium]|nr:hypothetical protein [Candidatus Saccharibacteria bacterium]
MTKRWWDHHEKLGLNLIGWAGAGLLVTFYVLNILDVISAQNLWYQLGNLTGGALLIIFSVKLKIWPNVLTNAVWFVAAVVAVAMLLTTGK